VIWLHIPKTGSTFENILFRAACRVELSMPFQEPGELKSLIRRLCPNSFEIFENGHYSMDASYYAVGAYFTAVTILRKPWARTLSGFRHNLHDCPQMQREFGIDENDPKSASAFYRHNVTPPTVRRYVKCVSGCASRMLTGLPCGKTIQHPTVSDVPMATTRLRSFSFVGITEYWNITLRAFSARFSVPIVPHIDASVLRMARTRVDAWVAAEMQQMSFVDTPLYAEGVEMLRATAVGVGIPPEAFVPDDEAAGPTPASAAMGAPSAHIRRPGQPQRSGGPGAATSPTLADLLRESASRSPWEKRATGSAPRVLRQSPVKDDSSSKSSKPGRLSPGPARQWPVKMDKWQRARNSEA